MWLLVSVSFRVQCQCLGFGSNEYGFRYFLRQVTLVPVKVSGFKFGV
jgi:hypothetical protein